MSIYERQPGETTKAYSAFCIYRDMGANRSLESTAQTLSKSVQPIKTWSVKWEWVKRAEAWDIEQDFLRQKEAIVANRKQYKKNLAEFQKNHLAVGRAAFKAAATATRQILEFVEKSESISSWDDANKAANIIRSLSPIADLWAKALAVDRLLERLELGEDDG